MSIEVRRGQKIRASVIKKDGCAKRKLVKA
jgi:hypothetical protein